MRSHADLATGASGGGGGDDLATAPGDDLASAPGSDLAMVAGAGDLADPCANPPALGAGNLAAQCVVGNPPTVDGDLADWPSNLFTALTKATAAQADGTWGTDPASNDATLSGRFAVRWDLGYVYVAVSVTDDIRNTPNSSPYVTDNDAIELFFDGQHDRSISYSTADDWQLVYSEDSQLEEAQNTIGNNWPAGTAQKVVLGSGAAWTLEAAVPWSALGTSASLGKLIGFDIKIDDNDGGLPRARDLVMYYDAGSGGGSCAAPYCRTDAFGTVQLQGR